MGQFIREQLQREGVDTRNAITDPERLLVLVVLGIKYPETCPLTFYREDCAEMAISVEYLDASLIANSQASLITGTHFSGKFVYPTSKAVLKIAADAGVKSVHVVVLNVSGAGDAFVSGFPIDGQEWSSTGLQPVAINTCNTVATLA